MLSPLRRVHSPAPSDRCRRRRRRRRPRPPTTTETGETGRNTLFIIGGALIVGFLIMGALIARDARRKAPQIVAAGPAVPEAGTGARKPHTAAAKKKMRAKTRAQKQARKAHRR